MEPIIAFFSSVLIPVLFVLAIPIFLIAITIFIARVVTRKGKPGKPWMIIVVPILFYIVVGLVWALFNVFYGALAP